MRREVERDRWATFLEEFSGRNLRRTTRLQISGQVGAPLIEGDIPLTRIAVEMAGSDAPHVEITLGGGARRVRCRLPLFDEITPEVNVYSEIAIPNIAKQCYP